MELYINAFAHYLPDNRVPNSYFKDVNGLDSHSYWNKHPE